MSAPNLASSRVLWAFGSTLALALGLTALLFWPQGDAGHAPSAPKERPKLLDQPYRRGHPPPSNH